MRFAVHCNAIDSLIVSPEKLTRYDAPAAFFRASICSRANL